MIYILTKDIVETRKLCQYVFNDLDGTVFQNSLGTSWFPNSYPDYTLIQYDELNNDISGAYKPDALNKQEIELAISFDAFISRYLSTKQPYVKSNPKFYMGFEIEGCVSDDVRNDLVAFIMELYPKTSEDNLIHHDGSVHPTCKANNHSSIEIVTPPLLEEDAFERLEWLLSMLYIMTEEGMFETNKTCGFHVNLSERSSFQRARAIRDKFAFGFMKKLDPIKWKKVFRRTCERQGRPGYYCQWKAAPDTIDKVANYAYHYSAINTQHLHEDKRSSRIEVRVAGGRNYHTKHDRMRDFLLDISEAMQEAHAQI